MSTTKNQFGAAAIVTLVALRFLIGFHFFSEGAAKARDPKPFSAAFFANAKGPFAPSYRGMAWDSDGLARLGYAVKDDGSPGVSIEPIDLQWQAHRDHAEAFYGYDDKQKLESIRVTDQFRTLLKEFARGYEPDLVEYFQGVRRRDANRARSDMSGVESLRQQKKKWEGELKSQGRPLIATADALRNGFEMAIYDIGTPDQKRRGVLAVPKPGRSGLDSDTMDSFIPYFDMAIGLLLMLGLMTRFAAVAGGLFLASVILSQFPGSTGAMATWPQAIEMIALFVLAATAAGRFAGLDLFTGPFFQRLFSGKKKTGSNS